MKRYVRKGVPNEHRARVWMAASGAQEHLESNPGYYESLLAMEHDTKLKETIHTGFLFIKAHNLYQHIGPYHTTILLILLTDMHRTFPDNILFQSKAEPGLQRALFNVLLAYGHHNKAVGYCQVKKKTSDSPHTQQNICLPKEQDQLLPSYSNTCVGFSTNTTFFLYCIY